MREQSLTILLIEDNDDHVYLARKAITQEMGSGVGIFHVSTAEAAVEFLRQDGVYGSMPRPDLIVLDLQLPGRDGFWVIRTLKSDEELKTIPIVVFSSSDAPTDIRQGYEGGANIYVCKPTEADEFAARIRAIPAFWSRVAHLPPSKAIDEERAR